MFYRRALSYRSRLAEEHRADSSYRLGHGRVLHNLAELLRGRGRDQEALSVARHAVDELGAQYRDNMGISEYRTAFSYASWTLCALLLDREDVPAAGQAIAEYQKIEPSGYEEPLEAARFLCGCARLSRAATRSPARGAGRQPRRMPTRRWWRCGLPSSLVSTTYATSQALRCMILSAVATTFSACFATSHREEHSEMVMAETATQARPREADAAARRGSVRSRRARDSRPADGGRERRVARGTAPAPRGGHRALPRLSALERGGEESGLAERRRHGADGHLGPQQRHAHLQRISAFSGRLVRLRCRCATSCTGSGTRPRPVGRCDVDPARAG